MYIIYTQISHYWCFNNDEEKWWELIWVFLLVCWNLKGSENCVKGILGIRWFEFFIDELLFGKKVESKFVYFECRLKFDRCMRYEICILIETYASNDKVEMKIDVDNWWMIWDPNTCCILKSNNDPIWVKFTNYFKDLWFLKYEQISSKAKIIFWPLPPANRSHRKTCQKIIKERKMQRI